MYNRLTLYLPKFLRKSRVIQEITSAYNVQIEFIEMNLEDIYAQLNLDTATWLLPFLEFEYGIAINVNKSLEERRSMIKAKMRGSGIVTLELLQSVADSWENGKCTVDFERDGTIKLIFDGEYGVPKNLNELIEAIDLIKPAHLGLSYKFKYLLVKDVHGMKNNVLESHTIGEFAFKTD